MSDHEKYNDNLESANRMIQEAESNPKKRVQFLPAFLQVFSPNQLSFFQAREQNRLKQEIESLCEKECGRDETSIRQCHRMCESFIEKGKDYIRKVHKQYQIRVQEEDQ